MKAFMEKDFLLENIAAKTLYHTYASQMPIIDYHCHISPREIAEDKSYDNLTKLWLDGDHYKWRLMRLSGVKEELITGNADDFDKFMAWAKTLENAVGNPLYHWSHLELQRYFDCHQELNQNSAKQIYTACSQKLQTGELSAKKIIQKSNVVCIGTTDDPTDDLRWHKQLAQDKGFQTKVVPTFRPDAAFSIGECGFCGWVSKLAESAALPVTDYESFLTALSRRIDYFDSMGCKSSDHSFESVPFQRIGRTRLERIFEAAMNSGVVTPLEREQFATETMLFLAEKYAEKNWVMQLHFGVLRNTNTQMFQTLGKDTGFDRIQNSLSLEPLTAFLDCLDSQKSLPKTILYSLNPNDNAALAVLCGCFSEDEVAGKVTQGAAWWFNDHLIGIRQQLEELAARGQLSAFVGMLTDSRSLLSYTRHEYFRRILCNYIGNLAETGQLFWDEKRLGEMVNRIAYYNTKQYFAFDV